MKAKIIKALLNTKLVGILIHKYLSKCKTIKISNDF